MNTVKTIEEIRVALNKGEYENKMERVVKSKYKVGHVFDEDQSVKWNNEQVEIRNAEILAEQQAYRKETNRLTELVNTDIHNALVNEYGVTPKQAEVLFRFAYSEHHSSGYSEVLNSLDELHDFASDFAKAGQA